MEYKYMMEDCAQYIQEHGPEYRTAKKLCRMYSCTEEYFVYLFRTYFELSQEWRENYFPDLSDEGKIARRQVDKSRVQVEYKKRGELVVAGRSVLEMFADEGSIQDPVKKMEKALLDQTVSRKKEQLAFWWHDDACKMHYLVGQILEPEEDLPKGMRGIYIPKDDYAVFSFKEEEHTPSETVNLLVNYIFKDWVLEHPGRYKERGYTFASYKNDRICYYLPVQPKKEQEEKKEKIYGVDTWLNYIDEHILDEIEIQGLAKTFSYSPQHFRHVFRLYYDMSVADYIRKKRLQLAAEELREGHNPKFVALKYGFKTSAGFCRAFEKEFHITPGAYSRGVFQAVDLKKYYLEYKDTLHISIVDIKDIKMIGYSVIAGRGEDVDIPAQIHYWVHRDFPCLKNTRFSCNRQRREDKIAMWYHHPPECVNVEYILGPVVKNFEDMPEDMYKVTIEGGRYAIFETGKDSDMENLPETLRMFSRCVFYGWVKEYRDQVDLTRLTFERYRDSKVYLYVPIKEKKIL